MNRIEKLIEEMCPEGVPYHELNQVTQLSAGDRVTKSLMSTSADYPAYGAGTVPTGRYDSYNRENCLIVSRAGAGAGYVNFIKEKFWATDVCFVAEEVKEFALIRFVYFWMKSQEADLMRQRYGGSMPKLNKQYLWKHPVPIPPLEIQKEIVNILDKFTQLEAELEAELEAREKQYEEVRRRLLDFESDTSNHPLGEMIREMCPEGIKASSLGANCDFVRGSTLDKKDLRDSGLPVVHYGEIHTKYGYKSSESISFVEPHKADKMRKANPGDLVLVTTSEDVEAVAKPMVWLGVKDLNVGGESYIIRSEIDSLYLAHFFMSPQFKQASLRYISGTKVKRISSRNLSKIELPVPPLDIQKEIVRILDNLNSLVNSVNEGIPAEIAARRKQYEYYRDKLLTFKELDAA